MNALEWIHRRRVQIATVVASIALATFTALELPWLAIVLGLGIIAAITSVASEEARLDRAKEQSSRIAQLEAEAVAHGQALQGASDAARRSADEALVSLVSVCGGDPNKVRATVYYRREFDWVRLARYSANVAFKESGRLLLPLSHGLLNRALERSVAEANDLPDRERAPREYDREQIRLGLEPGASGHLRMPSRSYALFRIDGPPTERPARTFVLCLESTEPAGVVRADLSRALGAWLPAMHRAFGQVCGDE